MAKNSKEKDDIVQGIFSTKGILIAIFLLIGYWIFFKGDGRQVQKSMTLPDRTVVGVSDTLNQAAIEELGVDLTENLDPKVVPGLVEEAMKETVNSGAQEKDFAQTLVTKVSNKIRDISTIDLNNDGIADPVMVVPQALAEDSENLLLSIRVPDPSEVKTLPEGSDQKAWVDIAENKSIEIMSTAAIKENDQNMMIQTAPNQQLYSGHSQPYYHHHTSLSSILMTSMMMNWMFAPRYYGGFGAYGAGYAPRTTTAISQNRNVAGLSKAAPSSTAAKNSRGQSVASTSKKVPPKSLNQIKSTQFKSRNSQNVTRSGGFGKTRSSVASQRTTAPRKTFRAPTRRSSGFSFGRSSGRSFRGFGRRR
ncbi:MAG: hypothetical protein HQM13_10970 [SAR324 cluster bacterium]|nr:hypothetical protein [SAR324 cluster bacterium]